MIVVLRHTTGYPFVKQMTTDNVYVLPGTSISLSRCGETIVDTHTLRRTRWIQLDLVRLQLSGVENSSDVCCWGRRKADVLANGTRYPAIYPRTWRVGKRELVVMATLWLTKRYIIVHFACALRSCKVCYWRSLIIWLTLLGWRKLFVTKRAARRWNISTFDMFVWGRTLNIER